MTLLNIWKKSLAPSYRAKVNTGFTKTALEAFATWLETDVSALRRRAEQAEQAEQIDHARLLKLLQTIWDEAEHLSVFYNGEMQWAVDALAAYRETEQA